MHCVKFWGNLKRKRVKNYHELPLMDLSMQSKNLYNLSIAKQMICYGSLSHMFPFFDVCARLKKLTSMYEGHNVEMNGEGSTCMDK